MNKWQAPDVMAMKPLALGKCFPTECLLGNDFIWNLSKSLLLCNGSGQTSFGGAGIDLWKDVSCLH